MKKTNVLNVLMLFIIFTGIVSTFTACTTIKGTIIMKEKPFGSKFELSLNEWNGKDKCEMTMKKDEVIQVEIFRENGKISMSILGKSGSLPYTGNNLESGTFTVAVQESDDYMIRINGINATGSIILTNLSK